MYKKQSALEFPVIQLVVVLVSLHEPLRGFFVVVSVRETVVRRWIGVGEPFPIALYFPV
jgi:hypothetical protein